MQVSNDLTEWLRTCQRLKRSNHNDFVSTHGNHIERLFGFCYDD